MNRPFENALLFYLAATAALALYYAQSIYKLGYFIGQHTLNKRLEHVKKRTVAQDNILQYPFGKTKRETAETSDSDSVHQSRIEPENQEPQEN